MKRPHAPLLSLSPYRRAQLGRRRLVEQPRELPVHRPHALGRHRVRRLQAFEDLGHHAGLVRAAHQKPDAACGVDHGLSLIHISEPTRLGMISYAVFCLKKKKHKKNKKTHKKKTKIKTHTTTKKNRHQ